MADKKVTDMSNISTQTSALVTAIAEAFAAVKAAAATGGNALTLEGKSLAEVLLLATGQAGLTSKSVLDDLNAFKLTLNQVQNYGIATKVEAEAYTSNVKYMTPLRTHELLSKFWADTVGTAPATLDTIQEIATAITNNQDAITTLNNIAADKVSNATFTSNINNLTTAIQAVDARVTALFTTDAIASAGASTSHFITPKQMRDEGDAVRAEVTASLTALTTAFVNAKSHIES